MFFQRFTEFELQNWQKRKTASWRIWFPFEETGGSTHPFDFLFNFGRNATDEHNIWTIVEFDEASDCLDEVGECVRIIFAHHIVSEYFVHFFPFW